MPTPAWFSRTCTFASYGALLAGLAIVPAGPASAVPGPLLTQYEADGTTTADPGCTPTGDTVATTGLKALHHGHAKGSVNLVTTWTSSGNSSDVTTVSGHYGGTGRLVLHRGAFKSAVLRGSGHVTIARALGGSSTCAVGATLSNFLAFDTTQPKAGWFYVTRNTSKISAAETIIENLDTGQPVIFELYQGSASSVTQRAFAKHGTYFTEVAAGIQGGLRQIPTKNGGTVSRARLTNTMSAAFYDAGSTFSTKGSAGHFVRFPGAVSCAHHSAKLTWRGSASRVAAGAFYVNGKKKATASNPKPGHSVVLRHLSKTADNKITAKLSLNGGGKASVTRAFVPCKD